MKPELAQAADVGVPLLVRAGGRPDHGDGAGIEDGVDVGAGGGWGVHGRPICSTRVGVGQEKQTRS